MSAFGGKADIPLKPPHVRFFPKADLLMVLGETDFSLSFNVGVLAVVLRSGKETRWAATTSKMSVIR